MFNWLLLVFVLLISNPLWGQSTSTSESIFNWSSQGELTLESRLFNDDHKNTTEDRGGALYAKLEFKGEGELFDLRFSGFSRSDTYDQDRAVMIIEEAYLEKRWGRAKINIGFQVFNWTALEAFHPADVINSRNFDSDLEKLEKKGELTLGASFELFNGDISFYYFPKYEKPLFPGSKSRLGQGVNVESPRWVEGHDRLSGDNYGHQYGMRFTQTFGQNDLALHFLHHMDRDNPMIYYDLIEYRPYYFYVNQFGGTLQSVLFEGVLLKAEAAYNDFRNEQLITNVLVGSRQPVDHFLGALGLEKTMSLEIGHDVVFIFEYMHLRPSEDINDTRKYAINIFQDDALLGIRYSLNDVMGKEFFFSWIQDIDRTHEKLFTFSYSQRLSDFWKIKTGVRLFQAKKKANLPVGLEVLDQADQVYLNLSRFF